MSCGEGAKGPRLYDLTEIADTASSAHRLVNRRNIDTGELAYSCYLLGFSARHKDTRIRFDSLVPPADDLTLADRLWRPSEDATACVTWTMTGWGESHSSR